MNKKPSLLPSGFYDLLPPDAAKEFGAVVKFMQVFSTFGYEQVAAPLMEFENSLLSGSDDTLSQQTFRILDPASHNMMGIRTDITMQVARIASERMSAQQRPLRLSYGGQVLQSKPEALRSERQLRQVGIELIGADAAQSDAEVILIACEALTAVGIKNISIDINLPKLVSELCPEANGNSELQKRIKDAITRKDIETIAKLPIANSKIIAELVETAGPYEKALATLRKYKIAQADYVADLMRRIATSFPKLNLTLDPIEYRAFDYHYGISFSLFADGLRYELGRGGRYMVGGEPATGFTLYVTHLLPLLPALEQKKRIMVAKDTTMDAIRDLQKEGWTTLYPLTDDVLTEAKKLNCKHILEKGKIKDV